MANTQNGNMVSASSQGGCNRVNVRNGMKMVIDDRILQANKLHSEKPLEDLYDYINFTYQNGFTVCMIVKAILVIEGETYMGKDGIMGIKDGNDLLFVIYRKHGTKEWGLFYDEFNLLCEEEKTFYMMIDSILNEPTVEQV